MEVSNLKIVNNKVVKIYIWHKDIDDFYNEYNTMKIGYAQTSIAWFFVIKMAKFDINCTILS